MTTTSLRTAKPKVPDFMKPIIAPVGEDGLNERDRDALKRINSHQPKGKLTVSYTEYRAKIAGLDDVALEEEAKDKIWLSAYATSNPKSDYHWQCDLCYDESVRRGGKDAPIYSAAQKRASSS